MRSEADDPQRLSDVEVLSVEELRIVLTAYYPARPEAEIPKLIGITKTKCLGVLVKTTTNI